MTVKGYDEVYSRSARSMPAIYAPTPNAGAIYPLDAFSGAQSSLDDFPGQTQPLHQLPRV